MIKTKNILLKPSDIPSEWAYEYYLNIPKGTLRGSDHMIRSPFTVDYEPSFQVYKSKTNLEGPYYWRDFSSGNSGGIIDLVSQLKSLGYQDAFRVIKHDFESGEEYIANTKLLNTKGKVTHFELKTWTNSDYVWWKEFGISPQTLEKYNVACIKSYVIEKTVDDEHKKMEFNPPQSFSYFTKTGELARIYNPGQIKGKFIKVLERSWLQGFEQLEFKASRLLIPSSLKDLMTIHDLDIEDLEFVVPDSENIPIRKEDMEFFRTKYKWIGTLFDNDEPGIKASIKYQEKYKTENLLLDLSKDPADSLKEYGSFLTQLKLNQLL